MARVAGAGLRRSASELLSPYGAVLDARLLSDLTRGPVSSFAAHAGAGPDVPGGAFFVLWQAAYHLYGQWHPLGGSQSLADALVRRLESFGGRVRCGALVERVEAPAGRARAVLLEDGERLQADVIVTAMDPRSALLELLDPPLDGRPGAELAATHRANTVQMVVHVATDRPPPYRPGRPEDLHGLQSYVDSLDDLRLAFRAAEAQRMYLPAQFYAFTPSALDDTLAPPGHHAVYLASPAAPCALEGGWERAAPSVVESMLDQLEERAPGFRDSVQGVATRTPEQMERELHWPGAHPMVLDVTLDQLAVLRPTPGLADHRTPVEALYITGAGTAPVGGIAGVPGRAAARAVLKDMSAER
jgi:phytoene dehydrogenase-like protein